MILGRAAELATTALVAGVVTTLGVAWLHDTGTELRDEARHVSDVQDGLCAYAESIMATDLTLTDPGCVPGDQAGSLVEVAP